MSEAPIFLDGFYVNSPSDATPDWIKAKLSFKLATLIPFLEQNQVDGFVNAEIRVSQKTGNLYAAIDTYAQKRQQPGTEEGWMAETDTEQLNGLELPVNNACTGETFDVSDESIDDIPF